MKPLDICILQRAAAVQHTGLGIQEVEAVRTSQPLVGSSRNALLTALVTQITNANESIKLLLSPFPVQRRRNKYTLHTYILVLPVERYSLPIFSSRRLNREKSEDPERKNSTRTCQKWKTTFRHVNTVLVESKLPSSENGRRAKFKICKKK